MFEYPASSRPIVSPSLANLLNGAMMDLATIPPAIVEVQLLARLNSRTDPVSIVALAVWPESESGNRTWTR
jgi:hypothetical protein